MIAEPLSAFVALLLTAGKSQIVRENNYFLEKEKVSSFYLVLCAFARANVLCISLQIHFYHIFDIISYTYSIRIHIQYKSQLTLMRVLLLFL